MMRPSAHTPQASGRATQDMQLVQVIAEAHRLAVERREDPVWRGLADRTARLLDAFSTEAPGDPTEAAPGGMDRIDRPAMQVDQATADQVAASLMALASEPDHRNVRLADATLQEFEERLP